MSLNKIGNRKRKVEKPEADARAEERSRPIGTPAVIADDKMEGIRKMVQALNEGGGTAKFNLNEILSMDQENRSMPEVLSIPIGGLEHDMYKMLERTRLTNYQKGLYCDAIHVAEHGFGWKQTFPHPDANGNEINLDFSIPFFGDSIVNRMRAAVSVDGQSLEVFERTTSAWTRYLYEKEQLQQQQARRGIQQ